MMMMIFTFTEMKILILIENEEKKFTQEFGNRKITKKKENVD